MVTNIAMGLFPTLDYPTKVRRTNEISCTIIMCERAAFIDKPKQKKNMYIFEIILK